MASTNSDTTTTNSSSTHKITTVPLTSIFTIPTSCSSSWTYESESANDISGGLLMQNCVSVDGDDGACWPSGYNNWGRTIPTQIFSPGHCPQGYTSAGLSISNSMTAAMCCISGFGFTSDSSYAGCTSILPSTSSMFVTIRQKTGDTTEVTGPVTMWGAAISIQWEERDLTYWSSTSATTTDATDSGVTAVSAATGAAMAASTATSTATAGSSADVSKSSSGLSTGAGIGIGVGVGVASVAVLAALGFWFFRRKMRKNAVATGTGLSSAAMPMTANGEGYVAEISTSTQGSSASYGTSIPARMAPTQPSRPTEIDNYADREKAFHELDG
ncbi:hypothetical protein N7462_001407 [Penicillium macrosclerotiorum]|uniref:uncharacterized protein n=1 Tax=Penicillium macrosclerotiorum TaxID=303699 RepID=UPI00254955E4|nr:uncharacterized protein N7462_001407 [Penicillium macrosclerotiorum]KAJ5691984.1 hypothetical protein N7462_001407 [Penicillium macrosclerotiorum]